MPTLQADLAFRGLVHQTTQPDLLELLDRQRVTAYIGFDPTANSLHVGHLVQVLNLRRLQLAGHRPIALAGGGTGIIGDPGGKSEERVLLSDEEIAANLDGIRVQLARLLDFSPGSDETKALLLDNGSWLRSMGVIDFLRDVGKHFTVNQMVAKESVRTRLERPDTGISFTEFSYMLLQAYDFLRLFDAHGCRLQMGASDQWGNITMGVDLIRRVRRQEAYGLTTPLVLKADGQKFGKTESGTVWLDPRRTSPYAFYQFLFRSEDDVVGSYLRFFTFLDHDTIGALDEATASRPKERAAQRALARAVCMLVHGEDETSRAEAAAAAVYAGSVASLDAHLLAQVAQDTPSTHLARALLDGGGLDSGGLDGEGPDGEGHPLVDALVETGLAPSKSRARTLVSQGGISVNDRVERETGRRLTRADLVHDHYVVLRRGREYHLLCFE